MATESDLVVVDASVVFKWEFDDEEYVAQARALRYDYGRGAIRAIAPRLLVYEIANAIATAIRQSRIIQDRCIEAVNNLFALGVELRDIALRDIAPLRILELSLNYKLAAYDAAYLALAEDEQCDLWTGYRIFYRAVRSQSPLVKWIGDYKR